MYKGAVYKQCDCLYTDQFEPILITGGCAACCRATWSLYVGCWEHIWHIGSHIVFGVCSCCTGVCSAACNWGIVATMVDVLPATTNEICLWWLGMSCTICTKQIACESLSQANLRCIKMHCTFWSWLSSLCKPAFAKGYHYECLRRSTSCCAWQHQPKQVAMLVMLHPEQVLLLLPCIAFVLSASCKLKVAVAAVCKVECRCKQR